MERNYLSQRTATLDPLPICNHIYPQGRHCRKSVAAQDDLFCPAHVRRNGLAPSSADPLAELAVQIAGASDIEDVGAFIATVIKLACQNRISFSRATALTFMANSLLNAMRLANTEARLDARENPEPLKINWEGVPRPERENKLFQPISDSTGLPVP